MGGAPQDGFSDFMHRIKCLISRLTLGRTRRRRRDRNRQTSLNPARCQDTTVSGLPMIRAFTQPGHNGGAPPKTLGQARIGEGVAVYA